MPSNRHTVDRRTYLKTTGIASTAGLVGLAGCADNGTTADTTGLLSTAVTDQPGDIADFDSCLVTLSGVHLSPRSPVDDEDDDTENGETEENDDFEDQDEDDIDDSPGRTFYEFDEPQTVDLVELQGEAREFIDEDREVPTGQYNYMQLEVSDVEGTVDGETVTVDTPGAARIQFNRQFSILEDHRTEFTADIVPVQRGQAGEYVLQPVPSGITVETRPIDEENGEENETTDD